MSIRYDIAQDCEGSNLGSLNTCMTLGKSHNLHSRPHVSRLENEDEDEGDDTDHVQYCGGYVN